MDRAKKPRRDRKKLSWIYRSKKRSGKISRKEDKEKTTENNGRIIVRNLPFKATESDVRKFYDRFGEITEVNLLKKPDGNLVGCGFIQFKRMQDAAKAIFQTNKKEFLGRPIACAWAIDKAKYLEKIEKNIATGSDEVEELSQSDDSDEEVSTDVQESTKDPVDVEKPVKTPSHIEKPVKNPPVDDATVPVKPRKLRKKLTPEERKSQKLLKRKKRARLVINNLSFKASEKMIQEHFAKHGPIEEIQIVKSEDGKRKGCAFIQFQNVQSAAKALHYENMKTLCDRQIRVSWAVSKSKFTAKKEPPTSSETP